MGLSDKEIKQKYLLTEPSDLTYKLIESMVQFLQRITNNIILLESEWIVKLNKIQGKEWSQDCYGRLKNILKCFNYATEDIQTSNLIPSFEMMEISSKHHHIFDISNSKHIRATNTENIADEDLDKLQSMNQKVEHIPKMSTIIIMSALFNASLHRDIVKCVRGQVFNLIAVRN